MFPISKHLFLVLLSIWCVDAAKRKIPHFVKLCSKSSAPTDFDTCIQQNLAALKPHLAAGVPEMRLRGIDPFFLEKVNLATPTTSITFLNTSMIGGSSGDFVNFKLDLENLVLSAKLHFPNVLIDGDYELDGKLMLLQLKSKGKMWINTTNSEYDVVMKGKLRQEKKKTFIDFNDKSQNRLNLIVGGKPTMYFSDLFPNNEELTRSTNAVINDNIFEILEEFKPLMEEVAKTFLFGLIQDVFNSFSIDELFLP